MALPTFTPPVPPSKSTESEEAKLLAAEFGDGYTQESGDGLNNVRRVLKLTWEVLIPEEADAIINFLRSRKGYLRFWYRPSDDTQTIKWSCKEWERDRGTPHRVTATFRQQFDIGD